MLTRVLTKNIAARSALRSTMRFNKVIQPGQYVCFCGCRDGKHFGNPMINLPKRGFQGHLGLAST